MGNLVVKDGNGASQNLSVVVNTDTSFTGLTCIQDPITQANKATVAQFHNGDNQSPGGTAYGLLTGGVAQLINLAGNLDRQRETGVDGIPALGIATGTAQSAMKFMTTDPDNFAAGTRTFTPAAMSGTIGGVPWSIQVGSVLVLVSGGNAESVLVTAVASTTFTCVTTKAHNGSGTAFPIVGFVYNQARDAAGELDGASGAGTALAVAYEYNGGAVGGLFNYDRERNVQGKGVGTGAITTATQGTAQVVMTGAPTGLRAGAPMILLGGTAEVVYVAPNYTEGNTTVPLQSNIANTSHTTAQWDIFALNGPGSTAFYPNGIGIDGIALSDPVTGLHTQLRQAPGAPGAVLVSSDGTKATYRYAVAAFAPVATPTAFLVIAGSATKTVRIKSIKIGGVATANGNMQVQAQRWSTAGTLGSAVLTALTAVKHDTGDAAATATVSTVGTANYTTPGTGSTVPAIVDRIGLCTVATGVPTPLKFDFSTRQDKAMVLRGVTDILVLSGNSSAVPAGGALDIEIETEEDNS